MLKKQIEQGKDLLKAVNKTDSFDKLEKLYFNSLKWHVENICQIQDTNLKNSYGEIWFWQFPIFNANYLKQFVGDGLKLCIEYLNEH